MKTQTNLFKIKKIILQFSIILLSANNAFAQYLMKSDSLYKVSKLFQSNTILSLKLSYSKKMIKYYTNDSTYISSNLSYQEANGSWRTLRLDLRGRGNFRRKNCDNVPLKLKIDSLVSKSTLFEGNKKLKLVLPCFNYSGYNDYILKEYLAYKLYELLAPYHFKTRLVSIDYEEIGKKRAKPRKLLGFLIEDIKNVANRFDGNVYKRLMKPQTQDPITSVQNSLFQYMIGNTDFSTTFQHNQKQLWANQKIRPVPYDFDMSGFVNSDYAVVSKVSKKTLPISHVTERYYRGFRRDAIIFETVKARFIDNKRKIFKLLEDHKDFFERKMEFVKAKDFINSFYKIIENDNEFRREVVGVSRPMVIRKLKTK